MAYSHGAGSMGGRSNAGLVPRDIRGYSSQFPGPIGADAWNQAARLGTRRPHGLHEGPALSLRERAEEAVRIFAGRLGGGVFKKIPRAAVAAGMLERIRIPSAIDQKGSSLCGPAALVYDLVGRDPVGYVGYVTALYETGKGYIRKLEVTAGHDLREYDPGNNIDPADWIALASLRDSENWFFDYQATEDAFAGITLPHELEDWFRKVGYSEVIDEARVVVDQEVDNMQRAEEYFVRGYRVCLFIHSNMLYANKMTSGSATPDHWVVLTSRVSWGTVTVGSVQKPTIAFQIYTWGKRDYQVPQAGVLTVESFLDNYYGFVAAKY